MIGVRRANLSALLPYLFPAQRTPRIYVVSPSINQYQAHRLPCTTPGTPPLGLRGFRWSCVTAFSDPGGDRANSFTLVVSVSISEIESGVSCISGPAAQGSHSANGRYLSASLILPSFSVPVLLLLQKPI